MCARPMSRSSRAIASRATSRCRWRVSTRRTPARTATPRTLRQTLPATSSRSRTSRSAVRGGEARAARRAPGDGRRRQGRDDPARLPRHQPAGLQRGLVQAARPSEERRTTSCGAYHPRRAARAAMIGIFNRSHYEDVLVVRVHGPRARRVWQRALRPHQRLRAHARRARARRSSSSSCTSRKDEQERALRERLERPDKHWKFRRATSRSASTGTTTRGLRGRAQRTARRGAVVRHPGGPKWYRNLVVARIVADTLEALDPAWPEPEEGVEQFALEELDAAR